MSKKDLYELDKILGEPVIFEYDDETLKTKKTLLVLSVIGIVVSFFGISISTDSSLFGLKLHNLSQTLLIKSILIFNIFFCAKFIWMSFEYFLQWRLRVSGSGKSAIHKVGTFGNHIVDYASDSKQSTLYNWWLKHEANFRDNNFETLEALKEIKELLGKEDWSTHYGRMSELITQTDQHLEKINNVFNDGRLRYSLERFDRAFFLFVKMQNWRWLALDFLLPIVLGVISIVSLWNYKTINFGLLLLWI